MIEHLPIVIIIVPLFISFLVFTTGWWNRKYAHPLSLFGLSVCLACAFLVAKSVWRKGPFFYRLGGWAPPFGIEFHIDHLSAFMLVLVSFTGWVTAVYAQKTVESELSDRTWLFWSLYLLLMTGLFGILATGDLFNLFVLLEVASLTGYALVAMGRGPAAIASFRYLMLGTVGASFYLLGVGYLYIKTGTLNIEDLRNLLPPLYGSRVIQAAFVFMVIGFSIKIALFPLHTWQPNAYTHAPSAVSVIISTAGAKTFAYVLIRVIFSVFTIDFVATVLPIFEILCWAAAVAMLVGSVFAIAQHDLKRMLAYTSVANVGYIVLGVGLAPSTRMGLTPAVAHLANHAVIKGCMFMAACAFIYRFDMSDIRRFRGMGRRMPYTCIALILAALSMIGMPPGAGFITKWYLILAAIDAGRYLFVAVIFFSTLLMIAYFWRVVEILYIRPDDGTGVGAVQGVTEAPAAMLVPTLVMGALSFLLGMLWMTGALAPMTSAINAAFGLGGAP